MNVGQGATCSHLGHGASPPRQGCTLGELVINRWRGGECGGLCVSLGGSLLFLQISRMTRGLLAAKFATEIKVSSCLGLTKDGSGSSVHDQGSDTDRV